MRSTTKRQVSVHIAARPSFLIVSALSVDITTDALC